MDHPAQELELARLLIRAESPSGRESPATQVLLEAFQKLGYDEWYEDAAGNAIGIIRRGDGPTLMFNGHLDTVPAGELELWPYPPFAGDVADGMLWGRGSCDMKGPLACMVVAARDAADSGFRGTLVVSGVVQEEVGGLGARQLCRTLPVDAVVLGEPSNLELKLGHRGRVEVEVSLPGRIAHAAKATLGENALNRAARFLVKLESLELPGGGPLGASTATPTGLDVFPDAANVVPGEAKIRIDYRNIVADEPEMILDRLRSLDTDADVTVGEEDAVSENGEVRESFPRINPAYLLPEDAPQLPLARSAVSAVLGQRGIPYREGVWWFATDAPYLSARGAPVIGFGPGEPERAHTSSEAVSIDQLATARAVYTRIALELLK